MNLANFETANRFAPLAQSLAQENQPGQPALKYRFAVYRTAYQQMLADLQTRPYSPLGQTSLPVLQLNTAETMNWTVGLLQGWAMVIDVLTFYQERIANEGFIRTASERRSLLELTHAVGYRPGPGVAATTDLVFTLRAAPGSTGTVGQGVRIPPGTAVQSVPTQGQKTIGAASVGQAPTPDQLPQVFETSQAFEARPEWNAFGLASRDGLTWDDIRTDSTSLRLTGVKSNLHPGDWLLAVGSQPGAGAAPQTWLLAEIQTVDLNAKEGFTQVTFTRQGGVLPAGGADLPSPAVYVLRRKAGLRPYDQGGIHFSPLDPASWSPSSLGLPNIPVHDLILTESGALLAATDQGVFRSNDSGQSWQNSGAGLLKAKIFSLAAGAGARIYCASDTGMVYFSADGGIAWKPASGLSTPARRGLAALFNPAPSAPALPKAVVRKLLVTIENGAEHLLAATDKGAFLSDDQGVSWRPANLGDLKPSESYGVAWTAAAAPNHWKRLVGTDKGVFPVTPPDRVNPLLAALLVIVGGLVTYQLAALTQDRAGLAYVSSVDALDSLFFKLPAWGQTAVQIAALLALLAGIGLLAWWIVVRIQHFQLRLDPLWVPVKALVSLADNTIFAGTANGVYCWNESTRAWEPAVQGLLVTLFSLEAGGLAAGLDGGAVPDELRQAFGQNKLDLASDAAVTAVQAGQRWQVVDNAAHLTYTLQLAAGQISVARPPDVRALLLGAPGSLYAGTLEGQVFRSLDNGQTWASFSQGLHAGEVDVLVRGSDGLFAAGASAGSDPDSQWIRSQLDKAQVDLDKIYPDVLAPSWAVLRQGDRTALYHVVEAGTQTGSGGRKVGSFTRLQVDGPVPLLGFDRQAAEVLAHSEALAQFDETPISGVRLACDRFVAGLEPGHRLALSGKRMRLLLAGTATVPLISPDGLAQQPAVPGDSLLVLAPPSPAANGAQAWLLQDRHGFIGQATLDASQAILQPSLEGDDVVAEACVLADASAQAPTTLVLQAPLQNLYDRATVSIFANVVPASHGQTVSGEILGGTARSAAHPAFYLKNKPLTYVPLPDTGGVASTLSVQVNQVLWHEVTALNDLGGDARAYVVRQDAADRTEILFGDGVHGARLPSGSDAVSATYRVGIGEAGNLPANSLTLLRNRPPGVVGVTNPAPASGGAGPEGPDVLRQRAPLQVRNMNRLVTLKDYEDFARNFNGIERAQASPVWDGHTRRLHLTIAGKDGAVVDPHSGLYAALFQAVLSLRAAGNQPVQIDSYERLAFDLQATLVHDPQDARTPEQLAAGAISALTTAFSFAAHDFEQPAPASEVIAVLQGVPGVLAVELEAFYLHGQPPAANKVLEALPARLLEGQIRPAQLLEINASSPQGIQLSVREGQG